MFRSQKYEIAKIKIVHLKNSVCVIFYEEQMKNLESRM